MFPCQKARSAMYIGWARMAAPTGPSLGKLQWLSASPATKVAARKSAPPRRSGILKRNLIYTGVTHGKRLVVLVGQKRALAIAVKGQHSERRCSKLSE